MRAIYAPYLSLATRPARPEPLTEADFIDTREPGSLDALVTLREGIFRRDLLRWDAERYFENIDPDALSVPDASDSPGPSGTDIDSDGTSLASLLAHTQGLIIGRNRRQIRAAGNLVHELPSLVAKGLKTLFLSDIPRDLFQEDLDEHFASQADSLPGAVEAFLLARMPGQQGRGLGYGPLIETAHRLGVRVRALESAAGLRDSHEGVALSLKMPIYESKQVIDAYTADAEPASVGKWIALTDVDRLSGAFGVPGLAALTGATGVRVADFTGTTRRGIAPSYKSTIVPDPGSLNEVPGRPQPYLREWQRTHYLMTLSSATDAPSHEGSSRNQRTAEAPYDDAAPYDLSAYAIDPAYHADIIEDIVETGSGFAIKQMDRMERLGNSPGQDARGRAIVDLQTKRKRIRDDASRHYSNMYHERGTLPTRTNPALEALRRGGNVTINDLLSSPVPGIAFGEVHGTDEPVAFLSANFKRFKQLGVETLFFEHVPGDIFQKDLDAHFQRPGRALPSALNRFLNALYVGHARFGPTRKHSYIELVLAAHRAGIRVVAIDNIASYNTKGLPDYARHELMNYYAMRIIDATTSASSENAKWIALMGNAHINTHQGVPGVAELTGAVGVDIRPSGTTALHPGWSDIRHKHYKLMTLQPDAVLDIKLGSNMTALLE